MLYYFCIEDYEVVEGWVSEVNDFGAFVRIGPKEALLHKSQIMEDHVDINAGMGLLKVARAEEKLVLKLSQSKNRFTSLCSRPTSLKDWSDMQTNWSCSHEWIHEVSKLNGGMMNG